MGNSQSSRPQKIRTISHQRSAVFSRIGFGCASANSILSFDPSQETTSLVNEKSSYRDRDDNHQSVLVAYVPTIDLTPDDTTMAYNAFIQAFPEYQLTWILDTLRRTDYGRLERAGETYVDYMGGALYPESLIRVHTEFLNRNVLGNTHSVSNR